MKRHPRRLALGRETIRQLAGAELELAMGALRVGGDTTAATAGNTGCVSEAGSCVPCVTNVCPLYTRSCPLGTTTC